MVGRSRATVLMERYLGGTNLEVFKFGMYILFPISFMYYFGTNLESRFKVPDFWPKPGETHRIPVERDEIDRELKRLRERRLRLKAEREAREAREAREGRDPDQSRAQLADSQHEAASTEDTQSDGVPRRDSAVGKSMSGLGLGWLVGR